MGSWENMDKQEIKIRDWDDRDLDQCAKIAARAWPEVSRHVSGNFIRDYIRFFRLRSNWAQTVTDRGTPVGLLFGRIDRDFGLISRARAELWAIKSIIVIALGRLGRPRHLATFLRTLIGTELKARHIQPVADGEITLLFLESDYHGRGLGRSLIETFVNAAIRR